MTVLDYGVAAPGYRLPATTRPGSIRLQVADTARSAEWYDQVLGLREMDHGLAPAGASGPLVELHERRGARPASRRGRLGLYHFAILLPDRASLGRFAGHLARLGTPFGASDHLVSEALYLTDPDGLGIEVYADRPRESWRARPRGDGRELEMATEPLDVDALVAAAGDASWEGMPAAATMGHLHLHVGDLRQALAFYHQALGLDVMVTGYPGALFLSAGGYHHHLGVNTWAGDARLPADDDARLLEWSLVVPDASAVAAVERSLLEAGATVSRDGTPGFAVTDPWGTRLRIRPSA